MHIGDWIIIIVYLIAMLAIGFFAKGQIQTMDDFILGGKRFGRVALIGTIVASMVGSGMTMGAVGTAYNNGSTSTVPWMYFGFSVGLLVMGLIAPKVRATNARSLAEIMNIKFGKSARLAMACCVTFYAISLVAINIAGLRTVIINCFGFPADKLVLATVVAAGIAIVYTSLGGMYAVVWTDVVQFGIMFLGVFILGPILGISQAGGISVMEETMQAIGKSLTNPFACGVSSSMIGMMLSYFLCSPGDPTMPQRALASRDDASAKFSFLVAGSVGFYMGAALIIIGVAVRVIMPDITDANAVLPMWILAHYPPVVRGFVIAGLIAAIMSSFDSFLILGTTHLMYDIGRSINPKLKDETITKSLPYVTIAFGVIGIIIALYITSLFDFLYMVFSTMGAASCPALFAAVLFRDKVSSFGATASIITGFGVAAGLYLTVGYDVFLGDPIILALISSIVVLFVASALVKDKKSLSEIEAEARIND